MTEPMLCPHCDVAPKWETDPNNSTGAGGWIGCPSCGISAWGPAENSEAMIEDWNQMIKRSTRERLERFMLAAMPKLIERFSGNYPFEPEWDKIADATIKTINKYIAAMKEELNK